MTKPGFDDIHPGLTPRGRDFDALVETRVPLEIVEQAKISPTDPVYFAADRMRTVTADRGIVIELVHREDTVGDVTAVIFRAAQKSEISLAAFQGTVDEYPVHDF